MPTCEVGLQFHLPTANNYTTAALVELGTFARHVGFSQIWVTDNLPRRNAFVILSALAATLPIKLGTAVMVQYFRNPVELASTIAAISELMGNRELSVGIGRGNLTQTPQQMHLVKPIGTLREITHCLKRLLGGDGVRFSDYPLLASYFNLKTEAEIRLSFKPTGPIFLYCGGNGPKSLEVGGRLMDGLIYGASFVPAVRAGKLESVLSIAENAARKVSSQKRLRKVAEINVSLSTNRRIAREFPKSFVASMVVSLREMGYTAEDFVRLGVKPSEVDRLEHAYRCGATYEEAGALVTEEMTDATIIAGDIATCKERIEEVTEAAREHGFDQVMFSKLGPDYREAMQLLANLNLT